MLQAHPDLERRRESDMDPNLELGLELGLGLAKASEPR
jgi:hypothetical protein